ncbi:uncharacterized protein [Littorina saxatilis]|uniref:uncharacterized protein isoform X1 n=1 Tax=Littorina saxatilis TaxID=31220 RepID=UPI0038B60687
MVTSRPSAHAQVDKFRHVRDAICILFTAADSLRFEMSQKFPPNSRGSMLLKLALNQLKATAETPSDGIVQVEEVNKTDNRTNTIGFNARPGRPPELSRSLGQGTRQGFHQSAESAGGRDRDEKSRDSESSRMRRSQSCSPGDSDRSERSCRSRSKERARRSRSPREDKLKEEKERDKERDRSREKERDKDSGRDRCSRDDNRDRDPVRTDRERSSGQERDRDQDQFEREKRDRDRSPRESRSREDDPDKERKDRDSEGDSDSGRDRGRGRDEGRGRNRDRDIDAGRDRDGGRDRDKGKKRYREREGRQRERNQEREDEVRFVKTGWRSGGDCDRNREDSGGRGGHRGNDRRDFPGRQGCPPQSSRSPGQGARPKTSDGRRGFRQPAEPAREWSSYSDSDDDYLPGSEDDTDSSNNDATAPCGVPGTTSESDESIIFPFLRKSDGARWSPGIPSESLKAAGLYTSSQPPSSSSRSITRPSGSKSSSQPASKPSSSTNTRPSGIRIHIAANTNGKRVYDKENWCKFCNSPSTNLAKHQFSKHKKEPEIVEILSNPKNSAERRFLLERVRNLGNYYYNCRVLKKNKGKLIPWRSPSEKVNPLCYIPCEFCLGFFVRNELWRHQQRCKFRKTSKNGRNVISRAESLLPSNMECSGG